MGLLDFDPAASQQAIMERFYQVVKKYVDERLEEVREEERALATQTPRDITPESIELRFAHHVPLNEQIVGQHDAVRNNFKEFATFMSTIPAGREKSLMYTALEEASFWAHAAVARQKGNQQS